MSSEEEEVSAAPKLRSEQEIAEALRLRPARLPVMRLSRRVLAGLGGVSAILVGGALVWGLHTQKGAGPGSRELYNTDNKPPTDQLDRLPGDYAGASRTNAAAAKAVPQLGPKLPGDLGRPLLNAGVPAPPIGEPTASVAAPSNAASPAQGQTPAQQRQEQARQRGEQEAEAARTSQLFSSRANGPSGASTPVSSGVGPAASSATPAAASPPGQPTEGDRKLAFVNSPVDRQTVSPDAMETPPARTIVQAGAVIPAALITGLRSDLPGQIVAQVTEQVYDSPTGKILLIPQGARLIGQYDAQVQFGQSRALLAWTRLIMPNGRSLVLERQPGADPQGYAGLSDQVDNHWNQLFRAAMLSTLLSVGTEAGASNTENSLVQAIREGGSNAFAQVGSQVVGRSLGIQPTLTIRPGFPVRVIVTRDLVLERYSQ